MTDPIVRHGGAINQYQDDAILATFNLPAAQEDRAANAVRAAIEIQHVLASRTFGAGLRLVSRIGINTGVVVGGLVGARDRLGCTVHGDDVNLAARLEALNKEHGTRIIVSGRTRELAGPERFAFEAIGTVTVRGRSRPVTVWRLDPPTRRSRSQAPVMNPGLPASQITPQKPCKYRLRIPYPTIVLHLEDALTARMRPGTLRDIFG